MVMPKTAGAITRYDNRPVEDDQTRLAILDALLLGKTVKTVALDVGYHPSQVQKVAGFHGWPSRVYAQRSRDALADRLAHPEKHEPQKTAAEPAARADTKVTQPAKAKQRAPQAPTRKVAQPPARVGPTVQVTGDVLTAAPATTTNPRPSSPGSLSDLLARGRAHHDQAVRVLAGIAQDAFRALRAALDEQPAAALPAIEPGQPPAVVERPKRKKPTGPTAYDRQQTRLAALGLTVDQAKAWGEERGYPSSKAPMLRAGLLDALEAAR